MIKTFSLFIIVAMPLLLYSQINIQKQKKTTKLIVHGTLINIKDSIPFIYAIYIDGSGSDSAKVTNGKYSFVIRTDVTTQINLFIKNPKNVEAYKNKNMIGFIAEPSIVSVTSTDSFCNATISGSKAYIEYKKIEHERAHYSKQLSALFSDYTKKKANEDISGIAHIQKSIDSVQAIVSLMYLNYAKEHPTSFLVPYALCRAVRNITDNSTFSVVASLYNNFSTNEKKSSFGRKVKAVLEANEIKVGIQAPGFVQNDTSNIPISLISFKGGYVLLDFWASWCLPCREANISLVKVYNKFKNKGFTVLSVSLDKTEDKQKWIDAIHKDGLIWTNLSDLKYWDNAAAKLYKINAIPQNFLIDPSGKIIAKNISLEELGTFLDKNLK